MYVEVNAVQIGRSRKVKKSEQKYRISFVLNNF